MTPNPFLGVVFHRIGGLASGSFLVPDWTVKGESWARKFCGLFQVSGKCRRCS
jgi:hypothetical protein